MADAMYTGTNGNTIHADHPIRSRASSIDPTTREFRRRVRRLLHVDGPRLRRLWTYYANPLRPRAVDANDAGSGRPYRLGQEWGLPSRITGVRVSGVNISSAGAGAGVGAGDATACDAFDVQDVPGVGRKEVVVENDIGWRIDTLV